MIEKYFAKSVIEEKQGQGIEESTGTGHWEGARQEAEGQCSPSRLLM